MKRLSKQRLNKNFIGQFNFKRYKIDDAIDKIYVIRKKLHPKQHFIKITAFIQKKPFTSFFSVLGILFVLMLVGNLLFAPKALVEQNTAVVKKVSVFKLGSAPTVAFQGKIEKSGVIKIVAQMSGIVNSIGVSEGQQVDKGTNIISFSTNYQGGNAMSIARQIAQTQYQNVKDTFDTQGEIIGKQKDLANKNHDNAELMRQIANQSASDTQALADLNKTIVDSMENNIHNLEQTNVNGSNDTAISQAKTQLLQFQSALVQVDSSTRNLQLQGATDQPPAQMAQIQHDIAIEQLDLQRKALDMNLEISRLSYNMALVNEANMFPSAPFAGTIDRIFVHVGDNVNGGTTLADLSGDNQHVQVVVNIPENIAKTMSRLELSTIHIGSQSIPILPSYVSQDATDGVLYSVIYQLDDSLTSRLTNATYVNVEIPIGTGDTNNDVPFIPLDAVVQTQEEAFVYVVDGKNTARVKKIDLGQIQGNYVEVVSGLPRESQVIMDRNVIEGDKVQVAR